MILRLFIVLTISILPVPSFAALWYVDNAASGTNAGTSWTNAWQSIATINYASVNPGDTIYISGGTTSKTYNEAFAQPKSGTAGNIITISTGQDAGHNGTVIMAPGASLWLPAGDLAYVHITGNVGGANHMQVTGTNYRWIFNGGARTISHVHWSYIDFPQSHGFVYFGNNSTQDAIEFDHLFIEKIYAAGLPDYSIIYNFGGTTSGTAYDHVLLHHSTIYLPSSGALGDDMMKWGNGYSFYNNHVKVIKGTYPGSEHGDFFQMGGDHYKIYNNWFEGTTGQGVFYSGFGAPDTATGILVYNNLFTNDQTPTDVNQMIQMRTTSKPTIALVDVMILNNTFVDFYPTTGALISINNAGSYTNCHYKNNLFKNSGGSAGINVNAAISASNNTSLTSAVQFAAYSQYASSTNDLHLASADTVAKDQGADLSALIPALDYDGITRPVGAAWDIGAYEYGTPPVLNAVTLNLATYIGSTFAIPIWTPSTDASLAGYNVYRCTASGACSNRIANITAASAAAAHSPMTQWFDSKLSTAGTYYYTVAPYNTSNVVGILSNEVPITITGQTARSVASARTHANARTPANARTGR